MNVKKYIQAKQELLKKFELFWNTNKNVPNFPKELEFQDWEEQEEFFERSLED
jgi:hypothetical protein